MLAAAAGIPASRAGELLALVGLAAAAAQRVGGYSLVMRQRLGLATALLGDPAVLILDEPANGLDPHVGPAVQRYGIDGLVAAATGTTGFPATARLLGQAPATAVLADYAIAALLAGATLLRHRDITA